MTAQEVLTETIRRGVHLIPDGTGLRARGLLDDDLRQGIRANKDQLVAILKLRETHRAMGFSDEDVMFIEQALLSGRVQEIKVVVRASSAEAA
jgi:hypothetical protein